MFKPGDTIHCSSTYVGCSCIGKIISIEEDKGYDKKYVLKPIFYGFGKMRKLRFPLLRGGGCTTVNVLTPCGRSAQKISRHTLEFLELFI